MSQDAVFWESEGDRWFARNLPALADRQRLDNDPILALLRDATLVPRHVLEIGASNGYRLQAMRSAHGCRVTAVEPSVEAIEDGRRRHPDVAFVRGTAASIPLMDGQFDLVIINFVLHWVDRSALLRSLSEVDRVLMDGGFLVIGDFDPPYPQRVRYHHRPEEDIWTYKQRYAEALIATNLYEVVADHIFDHDSHQVRATVPHAVRARVVLLRKTFLDRYAVVERV